MRQLIGIMLSVPAILFDPKTLLAETDCSTLPETFFVIEDQKSEISPWIKLTQLELDLFTQMISNPQDKPFLEEFNALYQDITPIINQILAHMDGSQDSKTYTMHELNLRNKALYQLVEAIKREVNDGIAMTSALIGSEGVVNYKTRMALKQWERTTAHLFYALMRVNPELNREKLSRLLEQRMIELYHYSQSKIIFELNPSEKNGQIVNIHEETSLECGEKISFLVRH